MGYIWRVNPTLSSSPLKYWYTEDAKTVEYFCGEGMSGCRYGEGVVISIYTEAEAMEMIRCDGGHWIHEMKHIQGYTHL